MTQQIAKVLSKLAMIEYRVGERYLVDVTHINHPHSLYIRPITFRENLEYLQQAGEQVDASEVQDGKLVIYKSDSLDLNVRGQITKICRVDGDIKCDIKALDYGCDDLAVPIWRLYNQKCDVMVPPLAMHCLLANCMSLEPTGWSEEVIKAVKSYVGNEHAMMTVVGNNMNQLVIELYNSCPDDISSMLTLTGYTAMGNTALLTAAKQPIPPSEEKYNLLFKEVHVGEVFHVRWQSGKDLKNFFVAEFQDFDQYWRDRLKFTDYCHGQDFAKAEDLFPGKGVGFQYMSKYERAIVKKVLNPLKAIVQRIDWGDVHEEWIHRLKLVEPTYFTQSKAVALYCSAPTVKYPGVFATPVFPGLDFKIRIMSVGNNFDTPHIVDIYALN